MENYNLNNNYIHKLSLVNNGGENPTSIENGYFIFTLMPSLRCSLNCPHCYLSLEQRRNSELMKIDEIKIACEKVHEYYSTQKIKNKLIICYWYGGEPTEMGIEYFNSAIDSINSSFKKIDGYTVKHTILTSLITIDQNLWFDFFKTHCENHFQTSFDGFMRGKTYVKKWEEKIKLAHIAGLNIGTITVVNNEILKLGATQTLGYLTSLNIKEASFLPFMLNEQNIGQKYDKYAPTMNNYSDFMIELSNLYFNNKKNNIVQPEIGQLSFILHQKDSADLSNIASQTLFLLPNGDFVLPDIRTDIKNI